MNETPRPWNPISEDEERLVDRLVARDHHAMGEAYDRYGGLIFTTILRIVNDRGAAEDLTQETFLRLWNRIRAFDRSRGTLGVWVVTIARNQAIDYVRSSATKLMSSREDLDHLSSAPATCPREVSFETRIVLREWTHPLRKTIAAMPENQRAAVNLAFVDGMSHSEIAKTLGRPLGTVKTWLRNAVQSLRAQAVHELL